LFYERLKIALGNGLKMIQLREKQLSADAFRIFAGRVIKMVAPYDTKVLINSSHLNSSHQFGLQNLNADGIHLNSADLMKLQEKPVKVLCGASCHNSKELSRAEALGLDYVVLSPVKVTHSHPDVEALGWGKFRGLIADYSLPVYALGGMESADLLQAKLHGAHGVAMLRNAWFSE
jgi:8-oxo-dGTP diphosphatase